MRTPAPRDDREIGPQTLRTIREIENEGRAKRGLPPLHIAIRVAPFTNMEIGLLADIRESWADRPEEEH